MRTIVDKSLEGKTMKLAKLLDETKDALGITSDYELARTLGVSKQAISNYRLGERAPDEFACLKIAEAIGQPLDTVIATVKASTEKDEKRREAWENYMKRLGGVAASIALAFLVFVTGIVTSETTEPRPAEIIAAQGVSTICIM
jgi:transcriptional regulator with XRE-family HTH domain